MGSFFSPAMFVGRITERWWLLMVAVMTLLAIASTGQAQITVNVGGCTGTVMVRGGCSGRSGGCSGSAGVYMVPMTVMVPMQAAGCSGSAGGCSGSQGGLFARMHQRHLDRIAARHGTAVMVIAAPAAPAAQPAPALKKPAETVPAPKGSATKQGTPQVKAGPLNSAEEFAKRCTKRKHRKGLC